MTRTSHAFFVGFVLLLLSLPLSAQQLKPVPPAKVALSSDRLQRLTDVLNGYVNDGKLSGAVALVVRHGKVAYMKAVGYRDIESRSPMTNDAIFRIASQSKALVSLGVMILQEEGKLLISDPVGKYIPQFDSTTVAVPKEGGGYNVVPAKRKITIRDLLTHTAGIGYGSGPAADKWKEAGIQGWYFADRDEPIASTVERMAALPMDAQPGEKFVYGYNTDILGVVIERASGKPLDVFLGEKVFKPLGMTDTYFYLPKEKASRLATVYSVDKNGPLTRAPDPGKMVGQGMYLDGPRKSFSGGAGILSTARDYATFLTMILNKGVHNGKRILSRKSVELMTVDHLRNIPYGDGAGFGLGFEVTDKLGDRGRLGSEGEFGWGGAYHSTYWVDPKEDLVVVYFTQLIPAGGIIDDHGKLRALVYQAIVD
ncbi:class A beta-lactamase-related serine hydrolase [bacterium]|nr:MAG: class A beta-lactamase-related serine hydrolase [bacterium]